MKRRHCLSAVTLTTGSPSGGPGFLATNASGTCPGQLTSRGNHRTLLQR